MKINNRINYIVLLFPNFLHCQKALLSFILYLLLCCPSVSIHVICVFKSFFSYSTNTLLPVHYFVELPTGLFFSISSKLIVIRLECIKNILYLQQIYNVTFRKSIEKTSWHFWRNAESIRILYCPKRTCFPSDINQDIGK